MRDKAGGAAVFRGIHNSIASPKVPKIIADITGKNIKSRYKSNLHRYRGQLRLNCQDTKRRVTLIEQYRRFQNGCSRFVLKLGGIDFRMKKIVIFIGILCVLISISFAHAWEVKIDEMEGTREIVHTEKNVFKISKNDIKRSRNYLISDSWKITISSEN